MTWALEIEAGKRAEAQAVADAKALIAEATRR